MSKQIKMTSSDGVTLYTGGKYVKDDIHVVPDNADNITPQNIKSGVNILGVTGTFEGGSSEVTSNRPYIPTPNEMQETETQDTIYMLYDANDYRCCPAFRIAFTSCVVTVQKYMNTTLVSEYTLNDVVSNTTYYMQFSEEDNDYETYNYIVIKLQGNITKHLLDYQPKFNGFSYDCSELLEVSGKCVNCGIRVHNHSSVHYYKKLIHYSFLGVNSTDMKYLFNTCYSLKTVMLDAPLAENMSYAFRYCHTLQAVELTNANNVTLANEIFYQCYILNKIDIPNIKVSFSLPSSTILTRSELVKILNNLATVTTTQTLTLGSTNLAKLTEEEKAIATNKGWTLA